VARAIVNQIIDEFRQRFQKDLDADVPLALRQEAPDVVFSALLEEDKPVNPEDALLGAEGLSELPPPLAGPSRADVTLDELLGASQPALEAPTLDPMMGMGMGAAPAEAPMESPLPLPPEL